MLYEKLPMITAENIVQICGFSVENAELAETLINCENLKLLNIFLIVSQKLK